MKRLPGQIGLELGVDRRDQLVEAVARADRHAQHRAELGDRERRADAVAGGVGEEEERAAGRLAGDRHQVVAVAAGLVGGMRRGGEVDAGERRQLARPGRLLDLTGDLQIALELEQGLQARAHRLLRLGQPLDLGDVARDRRLGLEVAGGDPLAADDQRLDRRGDAARRRAGARERDRRARRRSGRRRSRGSARVRRTARRPGISTATICSPPPGSAKRRSRPHQSSPSLVKRRASRSASGPAASRAARTSSNRRHAEVARPAQEEPSAGSSSRSAKRPRPGDQPAVAGRARRPPRRA